MKILSSEKFFVVFWHRKVCRKICRSRFTEKSVDLESVEKSVDLESVEKSVDLEFAEKSVDLGTQKFAEKSVDRP